MTPDTPTPDEAFDEDAFDELLVAYALDACDADEARAVEAVLADRPDLAAEAARLANAAAWIGATEVLAAPAALRTSVLGAARARRVASGFAPAMRSYASAALRLGETIEALATDDLGEVTANGLSARDLIVHVAAQESLAAQTLGVSPVPEIDETGVDARTALFVARFGGRSLDEVLGVWRASVAAVQARAAAPGAGGEIVEWLGVPLPLDALLVARAFENWLHRDDLRRIEGRPVDPPPAPELHEMATLSMGVLPAALTVSGRGQPGKTARLVLTGVGGGAWMVPMESGEEAGTTPDVTLTTDVVDWCLLVGERLDAEAFECRVDGDGRLARDLVASAPTFAVL